MHLEVVGKTDVGRKRDHNEDNFLLLPEENVFCVADGMGGHSSGEVASQIAVTEIGEFFKMTSEDDEVTWPFRMDKAYGYDENRISVAIKLANMRIFETSRRNSKQHGMGTTVVAVYCKDRAAFVAHVGDSRVYRYIAAEQRLVQVTEDHSLLNDYIRAKRLTPEEIANFPHKNVIVRALGMKDSVLVDVARVEPKENDTFLLCSDGLSGMISDEQMQEILRTESDLARATEKLIAGANAAGGTDNITCVLLRWHEADMPALPFGH
ncbi:MAG: Stp1/IreP family PP2C-type Ser/Thr phosphatase [Myxococcales bacterium]|jgi:protein phosphatase|nr:Stp1/IreP family PP2C-type Ser/Thr phosphatase [Myxococcales bacterium]